MAVSIKEGGGESQRQREERKDGLTLKNVYRVHRLAQLRLSIEGIILDNFASQFVCVVCVCVCVYVWLLDSKRKRERD